MLNWICFRASAAGRASHMHVYAARKARGPYVRLNTRPCVRAFVLVNAKKRPRSAAGSFDA